MIRKALEMAIVKAGSSSALAAELDVSPSEITRFQSGECGFRIAKIEKLLDYAGLTVVDKNERERLIDSAFLYTDLYKDLKRRLTSAENT